MKRESMGGWLEVLSLLSVIRMADAITGGHSLYRFLLLHTGAVIAFTVGVRSLLLVKPFERWNDDISDRQRFSETVGFVLGLLYGLGCSVSAYLTNWPFDPATVLQTPQDGGWLSVGGGFVLVILGGGLAGWWLGGVGSIALGLIGRFPS
jgi:hypothetical protein